jgi:hypothetical protein
VVAAKFKTEKVNLAAILFLSFKSIQLIAFKEPKPQLPK